MARAGNGPRQRTAPARLSRGQTFTAMPAMLAELKKHPEAGLLEAWMFWSGRVFLVVQYWSSVEDLGRYARNPRLAHQPAWAVFNAAGAGNADTGLFHETYVVPRQDPEFIDPSLS